MSRTNRTIRFKPSELAVIETDAAAAGVSVSEYIRQAVAEKMGHQMLGAADLHAEIAALRALRAEWQTDVGQHLAHTLAQSATAINGLDDLRLS